MKTRSRYYPGFLKLNKHTPQGRQKWGQMKEKILKHKKLIIVLLVLVVIVVLFVVNAGNASNIYYVDETAVRRDIVTYHTFTGNIEAVNEVTIMPKAVGEVTAVYFKEGDEVKTGDVLAQLDDTTVRDNITVSEAQLSNSDLQNYYAVRDAKKAYEDYRNNLENGENSTLVQAKSALDSARAAYESAKDTYEKAKLELDNNIDASMIAANSALESTKLALDQARQRYDDNEADIRGADKGVSNAEDAYEANPSAETAAALATAKATLEALEDARTTLQNAVDTAQQSYDNQYRSYLSTYNTANTTLSRYYDSMMAAKDSYESAQASYDTAVTSVNQALESYANTAEKTEALSNNDVATAQLDSLYNQLDNYKIIATIDGTLTDFDLKVGDTLSGTIGAAEITDYSLVQVSIKIDEYDILGVEDGSPVTINVDAIDREYAGTIKNVSKKATVDRGVSYFTADVEFEADSYIRTGMSVEVKIKNHDVSNVVSVSMNALSYENDNTPYVTIKKGRKTEKKYITVGVTDGSYVEVKEGLDEGDTVQAMSAMMAAMMSLNGMSY